MRLRVTLLIAGALASLCMEARDEPTREVVIYKPPRIETRSTAREIKLAKHLKASGATMYGAYWCSHCNSQKVAFGAEAARMIRYVDPQGYWESGCAPDGFDSERKLCQSRGVKGYPTWEINGELYPGEKSLDELGELSGFKG